MRTEFSAERLATPSGARANEILRSCVHCGFCNATCPTYQLTGDELDGPRGRIYLIRELLETGADAGRAERHLDRCLTCRACETTCPSGVAYGELAEIARHEIGAGRSGSAGVLRRLLRWMVPRPARLRAFVRLGRLFKPFVPKRLASGLPGAVGVPVRSGETTFDTRVVLLNGCAQQVSTGQTNLHLSELLQSHEIGVVTVPAEACCGSLDLHLGAQAPALAFVRRNVDALFDLLEDVEAIVSSASGCGVTIKDYGRLLADDPDYAERAAAVAAATVDVSEYLHGKGLRLAASRAERRVAWHSPCTLQHGQRLVGTVEALLEGAGYELTQVPDAHLCCGSAGTYSILQPDMAARLRSNKLEALGSGAPELIATANVGCQTHLDSGSEIEVVHWIELLK